MYLTPCLLDASVFCLYTVWFLLSSVPVSNRQTHWAHCLDPETQ